jgi:hypothetical protein
MGDIWLRLGVASLLLLPLLLTYGNKGGKMICLLATAVSYIEITAIFAFYTTIRRLFYDT